MAGEKLAKFNFKLSYAELGALEAIAQRENRNRSEAMRELIRREAERQGLSITEFIEHNGGIQQ